jgi:hypothetical protein
MFSHLNIHKHTWTCRDGKNYNQIDHILIQDVSFISDYTTRKTKLSNAKIISGELRQPFCVTCIAS